MNAKKLNLFHTQKETLRKQIFRIIKHIVLKAFKSNISMNGDLFKSDQISPIKYTSCKKKKKSIFENNIQTYYHYFTVTYFLNFEEITALIYLSLFIAIVCISKS